MIPGLRWSWLLCRPVELALVSPHDTADSIADDPAEVDLSPAAPWAPPAHVESRHH